MILDVGCGNLPHGEVNVDLFIKHSIHRKVADLDTTIKVAQTPNFVCANAESLPFATNSFSTVFSKATLEHVNNPVEMLREMLRVSSKRVIFIVPHRYLRDGGWLRYKQHEEGIHKWFFDEGSLDCSLRRFFPHIWFKIHIKYRSFPNSKYFTFFNLKVVKFPFCLIVEMRKDRLPTDFVTPLSQLSIEKMCGLSDIT